MIDYPTYEEGDGPRKQNFVAESSKRKHQGGSPRGNSGLSQAFKSKDVPDFLKVLL
jgi:hypothetical protein